MSVIEDKLVELIVGVVSFVLGWFTKHWKGPR